MMRSTQLLVLLVALLSAATAQPVSSNHAASPVTFTASSGEVIKLDIRTGTIVTPRSRGNGLQDCGDKVQVCLTDQNGFAFSYFRKCNDAGFGDYSHLKFRPKVVSALHNNDVWMVFDAAPNYLFHYAYSKGIIGIYLGPTASFDFRALLQDRNFQMAELEATEYRITDSRAVAACRK
jgi:hypothetical protein